MHVASLSPDVCEAHARCWARIQDHLGSEQGQLDLASILVRKFRWTRDYAERAVEEYRRFCFLAACSGHPVSPSAEVDEVWHLHLQYTRDYWERFCPQVLGTPLHHEPGGRNTSQDRMFREQYAQTMASYQQCFGPPPEAFWPGTVRRFDAAPRFRAVDTERVIVLRRPHLSPLRMAAAASLIGVLVLLAGMPDAFALSAEPLDWNGPAFLKLYAFLFGVALFGGRWLSRSPGDAHGTNAASLSPYDVAYLAGGPRRVMDAAIAVLMARGAAQWEPSSRTLQISDPVPGLPAPLDAIAQHLRTTPDPERAARTVEGVLSPLRQNLIRRGLMLDDEAMRSQARRAALPSFIVFALGVAKIGVGLARDRPVGFLVLMSIVILFVGVYYLRKGWRVTRAGDKVVRETRLLHASAARAPRTQDMAIAVALLGTAAMAGTAYAAYHEARLPQRDSGSTDSGGGSYSDSGSSGSDSSGGDSGGDSGGSSGCGGCGGGGGGD
ncbi:uncharacterized protein (TIGR04222 family) [Panacagrimonas perspica]|uniref:Uncharacterized protein (TIGR04222 family) n=1 Tax=Panacagrimonas perspica TaxID=381431 RepID=A0A4R7P0J6_9GAMM|nr:TIGR04222 domain-containing membrane protein [Panacagrimonas perspica]TDU26581.1 uncharacterized protein (TIGR04222 family) [Panacagrimonas perspica]THD03947.1 hypothetical protein B1810_06675 [Panacagrimonas perspica]